MRQREIYVIRLIFIFSHLLFSVNILSAACSVSTAPVNFGNYDVFSASPTDSTGLITITCDELKVEVTVSIEQSPNSGGFDPRKMKLTGGTDLLNYNLYTNAGYAKIWGDGTAGTSTVHLKSGHQPEILQVFGRIPPLQDVSHGTYTDTLTVAINW
jgi:spore coat protein U-like protein